MHTHRSSLCAAAMASVGAMSTARASSPIQLSAAQQKCVDVKSSSTANGAVVQLYDCNGTGAQAWTYTGGTLQVLGNKCLDVNSGNNTNGVKLQIWDCQPGNTNQQWVVNGASIQWAGKNKCIDLPSGNQANWTQLQIWDCQTNNANQQWVSTFSGSGTGAGNGNGTGTGTGSGSTGSGNASDGSASGATRPSPTNPAAVNFGPNVKIFDASSDVQGTTDAIFSKMETNQFGSDRYAYFFKPGAYSANVQVGFYTTLHGLGASPDAVTITGGVTSLAAWAQGNATQNFWRGMENLAIVPTANSANNIWAVSQATEVRRVHTKGVLWFFDFLYYPGGVNWSSGGFMADSLVDKQVIPGSQQQFLTRNSALTEWDGGVWNMVFVGDDQVPAGDWPTAPFTVVEKTPVVREKPYLTIDGSGNYAVVRPALKTNSQGISWGQNPDPFPSIPLNKFYIAQAASDNAASLQKALDAGYHLFFTPGIYHLSAALNVKWADTIILGVGKATLTPDNGTAAITVDDIDGVTVAGLIFDAGAKKSPTMLQVGPSKSSKSHGADPVALFDLSCRVGGAAAATTDSCFTININDLLLDNVWLWRADHGAGVGWNENDATNGLIVNGDNMTAYGLFVEHFEQYQTLWNGNNGSTYFYQSEIPYDVPDQASWSHDGKKGWASYKVADTVTKHTAKGLGIYCNFYNDVQLDNAIETPAASGVQFNHIVTEWLGVDDNAAINNIINGTGGAVTKDHHQQNTPY